MLHRMGRQCSTTELRMRGKWSIRRDSNPRPLAWNEVTAIFTTDRGKWGAGERARLNCFLRSLPYALSRLSYGLSSGGIRTHHLWSRSISTLHHRQKLRMAGNGRCCSCPFGRLSYGISADGICTHVLRSRGALRSNKHLHHCHHAGEQAKPVFSDNNASSSCEEPEPATRRPSRGRLHGTCCQRRESNPLSPMVRSTRSLHHQRFRGNVRLRIGLSAVVSSDASAVFTTQMKLQNEFVAALSTMARRRSEPIWFALPSVDRDCSRRSLRQAPRFGARTFPHELPGSGSPVSAFAEITSERAMTRRTKTLRSLAREGPSTDLSISLQARSLPRAGRAPSNGRLPFGRLRRISYPRCMLDSCSVFANHFAKGAVGTPGRFASQHACFT